jgi:hypothetical protein
MLATRVAEKVPPSPIGMRELRPAGVLEQQKRDAVFAPKHPDLSPERVGPGGEVSPELHKNLGALVRALALSNRSEALTTPLSGLQRFLPINTGLDLHQGRWSVSSIRLTGQHESYPYLTATLKAEGPDAPSAAMELQFRSNGRAAFIDRTYLALQGKGLQKFRFAYATPRHVATADQALFLLGTLDPEVTLSRVMSQEEAAIWRSGEPWRLTSQFVPNGTHFGLNDFRYKRTEPYQFRVPRQVLEQLYARGQLVANTYEDSRSSPRGINPEARSPFGLEFELVVLGEGRRRLQRHFVDPDTALR